MPKTKISEYSATNSSNTDIEGINIDEGCPPSSINNAIRELMVHLKEFQTGASGDAFTFAGGTLMSGTNTISGAAVISGNINSSGTTNTFSGGNIFSGTNTFSGTNVFSSDVTLNAQKDLRFADSDSSNWVAFQSPATVASNVTWTLPATDGTSNQVLATNGSGTLSWATAGGGASISAGDSKVEVTDTGSNGTIVFNTDGSERMRVDASGNVGIGTSSPGYKLESAGAIAVKFANPDTGAVRIEATTGTNAAAMQFINTGGSGYVGLDSSTGARVSGAAYSLNVFHGGAYPVVFGTNNIERARITSGGLMLLGVTSTFGGYNGFLVAKATAANLGIVLGVTTNGYNAMLFSNASDTSVGTIVVNSGGTAYNTTSDYRLKENVAPMTGALATVSALKPCTYTWKADGAAGQGFIAHELQAVVPDCVTGDKDATETYTDDNGVEQTRPKYQGVDTSYLVATLTAAIQELNAKVQNLEAQNAAFEARLAALEAN